MEVAGLLGVNKTTLQTWLSQGCPAVERADRATGKAWKICIADVMAWRIERAIANVVAAGGGDGTVISKEEADRRRSVALAHMAEIDLDERLKSVVSREDAVADMSAFCLAIKQQGSNAFSKIATRAATMTLPGEIDRMCQAEWNRGMGNAQEELRRRWNLRKEGKATPDFPTE
ncbi:MULTISPECIES: terminase small subunit [unclassified Methylobacterium]|uniref:terminase small subunit n=1 Tax=unclassified Methylobacterium TaxID=2615210 RepID=UPI0011C1E31E|nr:MULTISPECIES: terminase small subunit [unclassified Methylobacterium]QEE38834.1 terminase small subunit [Methylobacterium sp. WL1]TXN53610.1 terminase small subunit [Methylobacterium sp. WL2]